MLVEAVLAVRENLLVGCFFLFCTPGISKLQARLWLESILLFWPNWSSALSFGSSHMMITLLGMANAHVIDWVLSQTAVFRNVHKQNAAVGIGGVLGNKGGSAIRFRFLDSTFCFICSHLAAHRNAVGARNANVFSIVEKLSLRGQQRANTVTPRTPSDSGATSLPFFVDLANSKEVFGMPSLLSLCNFYVATVFALVAASVAFVLIPYLFCGCAAFVCSCARFNTCAARFTHSITTTWYGWVT